MYTFAESKNKEHGISECESSFWPHVPHNDSNWEGISASIFTPSCALVRLDSEGNSQLLRACFLYKFLFLQADQWPDRKNIYSLISFLGKEKMNYFRYMSFALR